jgi:hypothetical protein
VNIAIDVRDKRCITDGINYYTEFLIVCSAFADNPIIAINRNLQLYETFPTYFVQVHENHTIISS